MDNTLAQFRNILVLILLFAVTLSGFLGHTFEAGAIAVIVLFESSWNFIKITAPKRGNEVFDFLFNPGTEWPRLATIQQSIPWKKHLPFHSNRLTY